MTEDRLITLSDFIVTESRYDKTQSQIERIEYRLPDELDKLLAADSEFKPVNDEDVFKDGMGASLSVSSAYRGGERNVNKFTIIKEINSIYGLTINAFIAKTNDIDTKWCLSEDDCKNLGIEFEDDLILIANNLNWVFEKPLFFGRSYKLGCTCKLTFNGFYKNYSSGNYCNSILERRGNRVEFRNVDDIRISLTQKRPAPKGYDIPANINLVISSFNDPVTIDILNNPFVGSKRGSDVKDIIDCIEFFTEHFHEYYKIVFNNVVYK